MADFHVEVEGDLELHRLLMQLGDEGPMAVARALYQESERVMTNAKRLTPVKTGNLRASGHVSLPAFTDDAVEVVLGFGGPAGSGNHGGESNAEEVGYAVYVHEDMTKHHPVGQAKFLEQPAMEAMIALPNVVEKELTRTVERLRG